MENKKKVACGLCAFGLVAAIVIAAGIGSAWQYNVSAIGTWFNNWGAGTSAEEDNSGLIVTMSEESGLMYLSVDDNGAVAETVTVTANVTDITARDRNIIFSLSWEQESANELSDYAVMTVQGNTATVNCLKAFYTPIILTATVENTEVTASCKFDYLASFTDTGNVFFTSNDLNSSSGMNRLSVDYNTEIQNNWACFGQNPNAFGIGTVRGELRVDSIEFLLSYGYTGSTDPLANTSSFKSLSAAFIGNPALSGTFSSKGTLKITDFVETEKANYYAFSINVFDLFNFSAWDFETEYDLVQKYCAGALLEYFGTTKNCYTRVNYSYAYGDKVWTLPTAYYTFTIDFANLTTETSEVVLDKNGYTFGVATA